MIKLVAIGDSITQGFLSGAIHKTSISYPALIAESFGKSVPTEFKVPSFPGSGLPLNIEELLRSMKKSMGTSISRTEWLTSVPSALSKFNDFVEDLYERGAGSRPASFKGVYHNLAVWGFRVADSFTVNSKYCESAKTKDEGWIEDDFMGLPSAPMFRTAEKVLNPSNNSKRKKWTQIDNLKELVKTEGVENVIIWLGANDCLGTVLDLSIKDMTNPKTKNDPLKRREWNLTNEEIFKDDYTKMVNEILKFLPKTTNVFIGTIPHVTSAPIANGVKNFKDGYYDFYTRFFVKDKDFSQTKHKYLTKSQVQLIDERIDAFNDTIKSIVSKLPNWHIVDTGTTLDKLAVRSNGYSENPDQVLKDYYQKLGQPNHALLKLKPIPNSLAFETDNKGKITNGGLFSLDFVHPSTMAYGMIAEIFLKTMKDHKVPGADPNNLDWKSIISQDTLWQAPPALWDDIVEMAEAYPTIWNLAFKMLG